MVSASAIFRRILPALFTISLFIVYLFSLAPDLTWAHTSADGGDLITAAATGGVAHPSGYPTFLFLARLFQFLPVGTIAYRTNLLSAFFTALTALFIYDIVVCSPKSPAYGMNTAGLIAGYAYGLSPLAWSQAVVTEVYGLHTFFVVLIIWLLVGRFAYSSHKTILDVAVGISIGLGMGNHLTLVFLLPAVLVIGIIKPLPLDGKKKVAGMSIDWACLIRRLGSVLLGLFIYITILYRAASGSPVNWGHAINFHNIWWLVSGALYQSRVFSLPFSDVLSRLAASASMFVAQFGILGLMLGFFHLFGNASSSRLLWLTAWLASISIIFSLGYATSDSYVYLLPFFLVFAIWIGFGIGGIQAFLVKRKTWITIGVNAIFFAFFCGMAIMNYPNINLSNNHDPEEFVQKVVKILPAQAIVLADGDQAIFSLWYYHFVQKQRQDVAIIASGLLPYDWYRDVLHNTYPTLNLSLKNAPSSHDAVAQANPDRVICDVALDKEMSIICYKPASQKSGVPFISLIQPVEKSK